MVLIEIQSPTAVFQLRGSQRLFPMDFQGLTAFSNSSERAVIKAANKSTFIPRKDSNAEQRLLQSIEKEKRRAEIYALNAVMRNKFEKEYNAYCENRMSKQNLP